MKVKVVKLNRAHYFLTDPRMFHLNLSDVPLICGLLILVARSRPILMRHLSFPGGVTNTQLMLFRHSSPIELALYIFRFY